MDEPTDPLARQLALSALTTEQFNLQTARMGTITEANGRSTLYLGALSSTVIAIAFVGQASELGDAFYLFALALLPPVFLLGVFSYLRLVQTSIEDMVYAVGTFRIRQYFQSLDPAAVPFFPPTDALGMTKLERIGVVATGPPWWPWPLPPCASATRSGASGGPQPSSRSCTRTRARPCRDGPTASRANLCAVGSHGDDDLAAGVARLERSHGLGSLAQWVGPADERLELAGLDELPQDLQVLLSLLGDQHPQPLTHEP